jgi:phospholipid/cholesterol/gamma-HCH transport system permease protein
MVGELGRLALDKAREYGAIALLPYAAVKGAVIEAGRGSRLVLGSTATQVYFTAVQPLPIFLLIAITCGFFAIVLADSLMRPAGLAPQIPTVVAQAVVREVVPMMIALMLVGRSGTAISTELGYMRVNHEVDALDAAAVNIDYFLVLPRVLGLTAASVALTVAMSAAALLGGYAAGLGLSLVSAELHFRQILGAVTLSTIAFAVVKAALFGAVIATINCFHGLSVGRNFTEIPRANTRGTVQCYVTCFSLNAVVSVYALLQTL